MSLKRGPPPPDTTHDHRPPKTTKLTNDAAAQPQQQQQQHQTPTIYRSSPLTDRRSTFHAYFSPTLPATALQAHPDFRTATHRIAAWRRPTAQRTLFPTASAAANKGNGGGGTSGHVVIETGHDDDGEAHAGARLARVLEAMGVGAGAVVVARWYGGVMLGPVRFAHVENCAREAVRAWRRETTMRTVVEAAAGERERREELVRVLAERDGSVEVLRGLLTEKKRVVAAAGGGEGGEVASPATATAAPRKPMDYKAMPVQALAKLEKARDATIAFILKELDKVEDEILKGMGDGDDLDEADEAVAEITKSSSQEGDAGNVDGDAHNAIQEEKPAESQNQGDSAAEDETSINHPKPDAG